MVLDGCHFTYGNYDSKTHDLIFAHADTKAFTGISGEFKESNIFNKKNKKRYIIYDDYSDSPVEIEAEIVKEDLEPFTHRERRDIEKALFYTSNYRKLYIDQKDDCMGESYEYINDDNGTDLKRLYLNCRFTEVEKIETDLGKIVGYKFVIMCDGPMFWQDPVVKTLDGGSGTLAVDTDIDDYTYPKVTIRAGSQGGDISLVNLTDSMTRMTQFVSVPPYSTIILNGDVNSVSGDFYTTFIGKSFPRLLDGNNTFSTVGDVSWVKFEWSNRRFI